MIDKATVQKILDAADIVEVVSDYVHLVKRGSNYMGLCPFHNEKTPSFSVNRNRNICHCFSCGKGGSPVNFLIEKEGYNYHDALIHLANKYGIKVEEKELTDEELQRRNERDRMLMANEWAMNKMMSNLVDTEEGRDIGLSYFFQRGVTMEAIKAFKLGYCLDNSTNLVKEAKKDGIDLEVLCTLGVIGKSQNGERYYDRFKGRVIFPILNTAGKVIAFGGRGIKGEPAKYINSPESQLYRKSNELYGIFQARNSIVQEKRCFLVEGYMDVIGMWQSGMKNVVASSGTSLTEGQISLIHRFTDNVTLIYDGDSAGIKASLRGIDLLLTQKLNVNVLLLPDGDDPDSFARKHTPEEFREYVDEHQTDFIDFKIKILLTDNDSPQARSEAINSIIRSIASVVNPIQRQVYIQQCSQKLNISEALLISEVKKARVSVMDEIRKRRDLERITREREENSSNFSASNTSISSSVEEKSDKVLRPSNQENLLNSKLISLEHNIVSYCVKYGLTAFCESIDESGNTYWVNVLEFVKSEMEADQLTFSSELHRIIFDELLKLVEDFKIAEEEYLRTVDNEYKEKVNKWYEEKASTFGSVTDIENQEREFREKLDNERYEKLRRFAMDYSAKYLGSHPEEKIRQFALSSITPKYKLSNYHSKYAKVQLEEDRIEELIPRAISEWKEGVLERMFHEVQKELKIASETGNVEEMNKAMTRLKEITLIRREVAKIIGERILSPSSRKNK